MDQKESKGLLSDFEFNSRGQKNLDLLLQLLSQFLSLKLAQFTSNLLINGRCLILLLQNRRLSLSQSFLQSWDVYSRLPQLLLFSFLGFSSRSFDFLLLCFILNLMMNLLSHFTSSSLFLILLFLYSRCLYLCTHCHYITCVSSFVCSSVIQLTWLVLIAFLHSFPFGIEV